MTDQEKLWEDVIGKPLIIYMQAGGFIKAAETRKDGADVRILAKDVYMKANEIVETGDALIAIEPPSAANFNQVQFRLLKNTKT